MLPLLDTDAYITAEAARRAAGPYTEAELRDAFDLDTHTCRLLANALNHGDLCEFGRLLKAAVDVRRDVFFESEVVKEVHQ